MQNKNREKERPDVVGQAYGIVLEIGFGSGLNLPFYKNVAKLYGLDPSLQLFNLAKERIKKTIFPFEYIQAGAEKIPLTASSIDTVVSTWNFCSISDPTSALKEISRVLKPNGKFIFIEHGKSPNAICAILQNISNPFSKFFAGGCRLNREIDKLITENGFQILKLDTFTEKNRPLIFNYKGVAIVKK
jgi:ubiquinone/menaquinone biosynthesis C-methylase UbiE